MKRRSFSLALGLAAGIGAGVPRKASALRIALPFPRATATPNVGRWLHRSVLLDDGRVLAAGGWLSNALPGATRSAEIFDPVLERWTVTGSMLTSHANFGMVKLPSGKVLVAGGGPSSSDLPDGIRAEVYDPATGTWSRTVNMPDNRFSPTLSLRPDGKVLMVGGSSSTSSAAQPLTWIYDPATNDWSPGPNLIFARTRHTATALLDGRILVAGGERAGPIPNPPQTLDFTELVSGSIVQDAGPLVLGRQDHTATRLPSGEVLLVGGTRNVGTSSVPVDTIELYRPGPGWELFPMSDPAQARMGGHTTTVSAFGRVVIIGGFEIGSWNPSARIDIPDPVLPLSLSLVAARSYHQSTLLQNGRILIEGGVLNSGSPAELMPPF